MGTEPAMLRVSLAVCLGERQVQCQDLRLSAPCTVEQALQLAGVMDLLGPGAHWPDMVGVWGRRVEMSHLLKDDDRLEVYRNLTVDPKLARRQRFKDQGSKTAGLFKRRRPNAKPGY